MATRSRNRKRDPEHMAVVHLGRAMRSLELSGVADDETSSSVMDFRRAARLIGQASDALIEALEKREGLFVETNEYEEENYIEEIDQQQ